ncbi:Vacuolar protein-sorting-associated protein 36 [Trachymyrmex septentrionalis]|uniref:Vacuolar protein-sorting-associated protein 36 n=1 Tax=Trachymyrmex septentrionalis TaxID=34720 RepID=A0A195F392_9HYME|nr:PREDICTED: vacuolar protein-sorting-associated protein 36 [Trachymyrmex septentrionalis]KYN35045.1 Vacuolar protein-sorting-associated protein 36 [Trachymyrmex septentrionalis]
MNRFEYADSRFMPNEIYVRCDMVVRLYDGDTKTNFENGELILTSHRILWGRPGDVQRGNTCLSLSLRHIIFFEEENPRPFSFGRSKKIVLHLSEPAIDKMPGPADNSLYNYVKLSFKEGLDPNFITQLSDTIMRRMWEFISEAELIVSNVNDNQRNTKLLPHIKTRTGIIGIERSLQEKQKETDENISLAFQDLTKLMDMAKDMVAISKTISVKIRARQGDITEDETVRFKAYLMSLGIDDPVTRDAYKSSNEYFKQLAKQLACILEEPIKEVGGMMTLTDVYCRVNRARGLELLSPEDLLHASRQLAPLGLPIVLRSFDSGVMVLQICSHNDNAVVDRITELLKEKKSMTAEDLAQSEGISMLLARERLLVTEKYGKACRDDSIEALRFYPNLFLEEISSE